MIQGDLLWDITTVRRCIVDGKICRNLSTYSDLPTNLYQTLVNTAQLHPSKIALDDCRGNELTYKKLLSQVDVCAYILSQQHIGYLDRVGIYFSASPAFVIVLYALLKLGAICVMLPTKYSTPEIARLLNMSSCEYIISDSRELLINLSKDAQKSSYIAINWHALEHEIITIGDIESVKSISSTQLESSAILLFTSGTTSEGKGVLLKNYQILHAILSYTKLQETSSRDKCLISVPIYHVTGLIALLMQFIYVGGTVCLHKRFDARETLATFKDKEITYFHATPTCFYALLAYIKFYGPFEKMRILLSGSSPQPYAQMKELEKWFPSTELQTVYGMTETASPAILFPLLIKRNGCNKDAVGRPIPGIFLRVVNSKGEELLPGQSGEIEIQGTCVITSYICDGKRNLFDGSWLKTGDIGYIGKDNYVWIVGRKKDMINCGGEKIYPSNVEHALLEISCIQDACVVGIPHEYYGEVPVALIVSTYQLSEKMINEQLRNKIASYEMPRGYLYIDKIPETPAQKPDKRKARELFIERMENLHA